MEYPRGDRDWYAVLFRTANQPNKWRNGMFYWNGGEPVFASYGATITDVVEWKYKDNIIGER